MSLRTRIHGSPGQERHDEAQTKTVVLNFIPFLSNSGSAEERNLNSDGVWLYFSVQ